MCRFSRSVNSNPGQGRRKSDFTCVFVAALQLLCTARTGAERATGARGGTHTTRRPRGDTRARASAHRRRGSPGRGMPTYARRRTRRARRSACQRRARRGSLSTRPAGVLIHLCAVRSKLHYRSGSDAAAPSEDRRYLADLGQRAGLRMRRCAPPFVVCTGGRGGAGRGLGPGAGAVSRALIEIDRPVCIRMPHPCALIAIAHLDLGSLARSFARSSRDGRRRSQSGACAAGQAPRRANLDKGWI